MRAGRAGLHVPALYAKNRGRKPVGELHPRAYARGSCAMHSPSSTELRPSLRELRLQPRDDAGVHLAHARLAQVESRADLLHRHVFVVVEDDDQPFVAVQAAGDKPHQVTVLDAVGRILGLLVLEDVDLANVLVAVRLVPLLVEADEADGRRLADDLLIFLERDAEPGGHFVRIWRATEGGFE